MSTLIKIKEIRVRLLKDLLNTLNAGEIKLLRVKLEDWIEDEVSDIGQLKDSTRSVVSE